MDINLKPKQLQKREHGKQVEIKIQIYFLGSFEMLGYKDRTNFYDECQGLHTIKDKVQQALNGYRSYWTSLQKRNDEIKTWKPKTKRHATLMV